MVSVKNMGLGCIAAVLMSSGVLAEDKTGSNVSTGYCSVTSISSSSAIMQSAFIERWVDISAYVCGGDASIDISVAASDVAFAIATAFAEVTANCVTSGNAEARATGYAAAQSRAEAVGTAIAGIWADISTCNDCSAVVDSIVEATQTLVSEAVAEAWTELYVYSDAGGEAAGLEVITSDIIDAKISDVLIDITGVLQAGVSDDCNVNAINSVSVGDYFAYCDLSAGASSYTIEIDAIADAGARAEAWACSGDIAEAEVNVIAKATAEAIASAVGSADVWCESQGGEDTFACGMSQTNIEDIAYAQASAFANAFAQAESCNCYVSAEAGVEVWGQIWAEAAINAYADTCVNGNDYGFIGDFQEFLEERTLTVTSEAIAYAVATGGSECRASVSACSTASPNCISTNQKCYGAGFDVVEPCCGNDYRCTKRNANDYRCKHKNWRAPSFWDGAVAVCGAAP